MKSSFNLIETIFIHIQIEDKNYLCELSCNSLEISDLIRIVLAFGVEISNQNERLLFCDIE